MSEQMGQAEANTRSIDDGRLLQYGFDAGFLSSPQPPDSPDTMMEVHVGKEDAINTSSSSDSEESDLASDSTRLADLTASLQIFSESLLRMELAEMEMLKAREALRIESARRRIESEAEMNRMLMQTQLQIASFLSQRSSNRKRKRLDTDDTTSSDRKGSLLMSLLQSNLML